MRAEQRREVMARSMLSDRAIVGGLPHETETGNGG